MAMFLRVFNIVVIALAFAPISGICLETSLARQLIVVVTDSWSDTGAKLYCFERRAGKWEKTKGRFMAVVGEKGMGWGGGVEGGHSMYPEKKEGDRKAPAGIFPLVREMGYEAVSHYGSFPYEQIEENTHCVDDPHSAYYNMIVKESDFHVPVTELWKSSELMKRKDDLYKWLLVVGYNKKDPHPGSGSCIFIHIWRAPGKGTAGCTAMAEKDLVEILQWLKLEENPALVQLPLPVYKQYWKEWQLPDPAFLAEEER